jgi:hypothetical protein
MPPPEIHSRKPDYARLIQEACGGAPVSGQYQQQEKLY